jgi:arginase
MANVATSDSTIPVALTIYQGRAGDRNPRAMVGSALLGNALSQRIDAPQRFVSSPQPPLGAAWDAELAAARPGLMELTASYEQLLAAGRVPVAVIGRCAAALATLPVIARHWPEACVVWFDAHADCNTPTSVAVPYLGGMPISGAAGLWDSGLGSGLQLSNVVLVGSRDIDPDERELIENGAPQLVRVGNELPTRLREAIAGRPVYVHLDCDVLEPGIVPTEYLSPGGLSLEDLRAAMEALSLEDTVGLEIAEYEATWARDNTLASPVGLLDALQPLLDRLEKNSVGTPPK